MVLILEHYDTRQFVKKKKKGVKQTIEEWWTNNQPTSSYNLETFFLHPDIRRYQRGNQNP